MTFQSILFPDSEESKTKPTLETPAFFADLNLDQIIEAVTAGREEYNLKPFFYTSLADINTIRYRHEIMRDFEKKILFEKITSFTQQMRLMREHLAQIGKLHYKYQKASWFLDATEAYCDTIKHLVQQLSLVDLQSRGFLAFRDYLTNYAISAPFESLLGETKKLKSDLSTVRYCLRIKAGGFKVCKYDSEIDYSADVEETFEKFKQGAVKSYSAQLTVRADINHVEAMILDFVALVYPEMFERLDDYCVKNADFLDAIIGVFDREVQFYISYLEYIKRLRRAGLPFCYPNISNSSKEICTYEGFDLALAQKLLADKSLVVCNDFYLKDKERILVVSGPNQGGKTTFARMFGQLHFLASIGCPVPGRAAKLFLFDQLFTHFEREEDIKNLRGKLQDDLVRIHDILRETTSRSIVIMNESFTSTTLRDAIYLSKKVLERIIELDVLCVCVTFLDELASLSEKTVSMVSTVVAENPASRTYKILRRPADGLSHAISIAEKHGLTYDCLMERIKL
jgi:DNA mismatch repair protein MutS